MKFFLGANDAEAPLVQVVAGVGIGAVVAAFTETLSNEQNTTTSINTRIVTYFFIIPP
jgi:hypothetical protein